MRSSTKRREDRLEVRLTPKAKSILKRAASGRKRKTVSAFILDKELRRQPPRRLQIGASSSLSAKQYDAFVAALDASPKSRPLRFSERPAFLSERTRRDREAAPRAPARPL